MRSASPLRGRGADRAGRGAAQSPVIARTAATLRLLEAAPRGWTGGARVGQFPRHTLPPRQPEPDRVDPWRAGAPGRPAAGQRGVAGAARYRPPPGFSRGRRPRPRPGPWPITVPLAVTRRGPVRPRHPRAGAPAAAPGAAGSTDRPLAGGRDPAPAAAGLGAGAAGGPGALRAGLIAAVTVLGSSGG